MARSAAAPRGLAVLRLDGNGIAQLPDWLCEELPALRVLTLAKNGLTGLPEGITRLTALRVLALGDNPLTSPEAMAAADGVRPLLTTWLFRSAASAAALSDSLTATARRDTESSLASGSSFATAEASLQAM